MKMNHISPELVNEVISFLANQVLAKDVKYDFVVGIGRGGLVPATMMAYKLGVPVLCYAISTYNESDKQGELVVHQQPDFSDASKAHNILIIDDICDTGDTFKYIKQLTKESINIETHVALFSKRASISTPDMIGLVADDNEWIVFPWEDNK